MDKRKKSIVLYLTMLIFILCNNLSVMASNSFSNITSGTMSQNVPDEVSAYFNSVYKDTINAYIVNSDFNNDLTLNNIIIGEPFIILNEELSDSSEIWYYPVYHNNAIQFLITIYRYQGKLYCGITQEYVLKLNEINYNSGMKIIKGKENIYAVDDNNRKYVLENNITDTDSTSETSELKSNNLLKCNANYNSASGTSGRSGRFNPKGPVKKITNGYECDMTNCFVKQYGYEVCWAASMATMIRYLRPEYGYIGAGDVAYTVGDALGIDTSTDEGKVACLDGRNRYDIQFGFALYEIYYTVTERKLSYGELREEIENGSPICMLSKLNEFYGHVTVIYGYYMYGSMRYIEMWNPGNGEKQAFQYNLDGTVRYVYHNDIYDWCDTICNGAYIAK